MLRRRESRLSVIALLAGAGLIAAASGAGAADNASAPIFSPVAAKNWTITVGVEGRLLPTFEGSDRYTFLPFPLFNIRRAGTPPSFRSARDGFGFALLDTGGFRVGPSFKVRLPRKESDDSDLTGLGDVKWAVEAGGFVEYWPLQWLRLRGELRQGFGGHHGVVGDLLADAVVPVGPQVTFSAGPRLTLASAAAHSPYFSVDAVQSAASGLPVYSAGGGLHSYGAGAQVRYAWSPQWATHVFFEYERLAGDPANSPIVTQRGSRDQLQAGIGVSYSFDVPALW